MAGLVYGVSGVVRSVSYADGLISVVVGDTVVRHRVGARGGIPVTASRELWKLLVDARDNNSFVQFFGRVGWAGWFDAADIVTFVTEKMMNVYYDGEAYCPA
jgi:hypothetical protein